MTAKSPHELIQLLSKIEQRSIVRQAALPELEEAHQYWEGMIFSLGDMRLVAPLNEVAEMLHFPADVTFVPGTHSWVKGVANVRGSLLPIIDLQMFLGGKPVITGRECRVLVVKHQGIFSGLLVKNVMGMRHFSQEEQIEYSISSGGLLDKFVKTAFEYDGENCPVFGMFALAESAEFQMAAL